MGAILPTVLQSTLKRLRIRNNSLEEIDTNRSKITLMVTLTMAHLVVSGEVGNRSNSNSNSNSKITSRHHGELKVRVTILTTSPIARMQTMRRNASGNYVRIIILTDQVAVPRRCRKSINNTTDGNSNNQRDNN